MNRYAKLNQFLRERADVPFAWGVNDCCIFAADWVLACTGRDPMVVIRGYINETDAADLIGRGGGIKRMTTDTLGAPAPTVTTAQRGDVVLFESGDGPALGVCIGDKFAAVRPVGGVGYFAMRHALTAWRVE